MSIIGNAIMGGSSAELGTKSITANGTYAAVDDSLDGYSSVDVAVAGTVLVDKTITANGTYDPADDSADGYSSVTVDVTPDILNWEAWKSITSAKNGTVVFGSDRDLVITATSQGCYTRPNGVTDSGSSTLGRYPVLAGQKVTLSWEIRDEDVEKIGQAYIFENTGTSNMSYCSHTTGVLEHTVVSSGYITFRFDVSTAGESIGYSNIALYIEDTE